MSASRDEWLQYLADRADSVLSEAHRLAFEKRYGAEPLEEPEEAPYEEPYEEPDRHLTLLPAVPAVPADRRPRLESVAELTEPDDLNDWAIEGVLRPRSVLIVASTEGLGKSQVRKEIAWRLASGTGALFGHYAIPAQLRVAEFEEENGPTEEWRRDEMARTALGLERAAVAGRLFRVSFAGLNFTEQASQDYIRAELERTQADVAMFDTGTSMTAEEWGGPVKAAMRFLHSLPCSACVFVHMVKPKDDKRSGSAQHGTAITDVMGHWTRAADAVALMGDLGAGRVRWSMYKRVPRSSLVLAQTSGLWTVVAVDEGEEKVSNDDRVLKAIAAGAERPTDVIEGMGMPKRTFYAALRRLRQDGLVEEGTPLRLTDDGREAVG